jgi:hypothetical protein
VIFWGGSILVPGNCRLIPLAVSVIGLQDSAVKSENHAAGELPEAVIKQKHRFRSQGSRLRAYQMDALRTQLTVVSLCIKVFRKAAKISVDDSLNSTFQ